MTRKGRNARAVVLGTLAAGGGAQRGVVRTSQHFGGETASESDKGRAMRTERFPGTALIYVKVLERHTGCLNDGVI